MGHTVCVPGGDGGPLDLVQPIHRPHRVALGGAPRRGNGAVAVGGQQGAHDRRDRVCVAPKPRGSTNACLPAVGAAVHHMQSGSQRVQNITRWPIVASVFLHKVLCAGTAVGAA